MKKIFIIAVLAILLFCDPSFAAWEGYDYKRGEYIEIDKGNLVRPGRDIEIYNQRTGEYRDVEVDNIRRTGSRVEIEVYDHNTNEYRTFEMDRQR
jgi:hypothetical protein